MKKNIINKFLKKKEKHSFEQDLIDLLKKYGYKTELVQAINISVSVEGLPHLNIHYKVAENEI